MVTLYCWFRTYPVRLGCLLCWLLRGLWLDLLLSLITRIIIFFVFFFPLLLKEIEGLLRALVVVIFFLASKRLRIGSWRGIGTPPQHVSTLALALGPLLPHCSRTGHQ